MSDPNVHPELRKQLADMGRVHASIVAYRSPQPPILDSSLDPNPSRPSDNIPGIRPFLDSVFRDKEVIQKFLAEPHVAELPPPSTNAPYLISVWKEVLSARLPVVAIGKSFREDKQQPKVKVIGNGHNPKSTAVKVDVVADNGRSWIRVNTTKNSRLLAELREIDSYMTDSDSDSDTSAALPSLAQTTFDNSILLSGRALLAAAQANPVSTAHGPRPPTVTIRFTRLDPTAGDDLRVALTLDMVRDMGIIVELGDRGDEILSGEVAVQSEASESPVLPTLHINLDLSILIALVSDLTHASLPSTLDEADARFVPSAAYVEWKRARLRARRNPDESAADGENDDDDDDNEGSLDVGKHSRALAEQLQQEMRKGLLQEMYDRLTSTASLSTSTSSLDSSDTEFWTTPEARDRCLRIVSKIGGPNEQRRASALFNADSTSLEDCQREYWRDSRYPALFLPLLPIRIFPSHIPSETSISRSHFSAALETTCRSLLSMDSTSVAPSTTTVAPASIDGQDTGIAQDEIGRAAATQANPKLTAHTVQSLLWGAATSRTTLTANRGSVKALLWEMRTRGADTTAGSEKSGDAKGDCKNMEAAAIWVVDPRSLAEGMRSDIMT
ncbi:hypothetical protein OF83DRAFT_1057668 [Amylostereum chailletii]|nr:hypothetical protein OF83DRAFT_1057668 [Amylostereum chailletii]